MGYAHYYNCPMSETILPVVDIFGNLQIHKRLVRFLCIFCCYCELRIVRILLEASFDWFLCLLLGNCSMFYYFTNNLDCPGYGFVSMSLWSFSFRYFSEFVRPFLFSFFSTLNLKILQGEDFWFTVGFFSSIITRLYVCFWCFNWL